MNLNLVFCSVCGRVYAYTSKMVTAKAADESLVYTFTATPHRCEQHPEATMRAVELAETGSEGGTIYSGVDFYTEGDSK